MFSEVIRLIKVNKVKDSTGELRDSKSEREVFAKILSIGTQEYYQAQASGFKPELKFVLADYLDYENEKKIVHDGMEYDVIKTYRKGRELEITVSGGVNCATT